MDIPFRKQCEAKAIADQNTFTLYGGGIRGGKSRWLCLTLFSYCIQYPRSRWVILRKDLPTLRRTTLVSFSEIGVDPFIKSFNQSSMTVTFNNGSQIIFMAESFDTDKELNRFRGLEINGGGMDELNEFNEKTFTKVIERSGSWNGSPGCPIKIIATCNPTNNWVKKQIYDRWTEKTLPKGWAFVPALITDNPHIKKDYLESLINNMPPHEYEIFVKGNWNVKLQGCLFDDNELHKFTQADLELYMKEEGEKILEKRKAKGELDIIDGSDIEPLLKKPETIIAYIDVANEGTDYLCMVVGQIFKNRIYVTDVIYTQDSNEATIPRIVKKIRDKNVVYARVEKNGMGSMFVSKLKETFNGDRIIGINSKSNKHARVLDAFWFIKTYCYFLTPTEYTKQSEYAMFMTNILTYLKADENTSDDGVDALTGLCRFSYSWQGHLFPGAKITTD